MQVGFVIFILTNLSERERERFNVLPITQLLPQERVGGEGERGSERDFLRPVSCTGLPH